MGAKAPSLAAVKGEQVVNPGAASLAQLATWIFTWVLTCRLGGDSEREGAPDCCQTAAEVHLCISERRNTSGPK